MKLVSANRMIEQKNNAKTYIHMKAHHHSIYHPLYNVIHQFQRANSHHRTTIKNEMNHHNHIICFESEVSKQTNKPDISQWIQRLLFRLLIECFHDPAGLGYHNQHNGKLVLYHSIHRPIHT